MDYRLIDIPDNKLDVTINENIKESEKILIVVSFIFVKGLMLILDNLRSFRKPENITIITSNYLKSTEPEALNKLLELKKLGANIYFFDSIYSKENFHTETAGSARETPWFTGGSGFQIYVDLYCGAASVYFASLSNLDRGALRVFLRKI